MKHTLLLILTTAFSGLTATAQNSPAPQYGSTYNTSLPTGGFSASIPLFNLPTANPALSLDAQLVFNSAASLSDNPRSNLLDKGWEFNFIPSVNKTLVRGSKDDEYYYQYIKETKDNGGDFKSLISPTGHDKNIYSFDAFGLQGKFYFEESGSQMVLKKIYSSDYAEIKVNASFTHPVALYLNGQPVSYNSNPHFTVSSFEITDKNGFTYIFSELHKERASFRFSRFGNSYDIFYDHTASFLLKKVIDRFGTTLLDYSYTDVSLSYTDDRGMNHNYTQKKLLGIDVKNLATVSFANNASRYTNITVKNRRNETIHNLDFISGAVISKNTSNTEVSRTSYTDFLNAAAADFTLTHPYGGKTRYTMENNDYSYLLAANGTLTAANTPVKRNGRTGKRLKSIIQYDKDGKITEEENYTYLMGTNPSESSGAIPAIVSDDPQSFEGRFKIGHVYCIYKKVTVSRPGLGKTVYTFDLTGLLDGLGMMYATKLNPVPLEMQTYAESGELTESNQAQVTRFYEALYPVSETPYYDTPVIEKNTKQSVSYAAAATKSRTLASESVLDRDTRHLVGQKVTDVEQAETLNSVTTFVKKGNAYFPETVKKYKNGTLLSQSLFEYEAYNGSTQVFNLMRTSGAKGTQPLEIEKEFTRYDELGNVWEYKTKEGGIVSQIWGYDGTKVVAELKNVPYSSIAAATITGIKSASSAISYNESTLLTLLNGLRNAHPAGFITTYMYKPLVGETSVTDANGVKETYEYDSFNRLYRVLNNDGLIIKQYDYNIRN